MVMPADVNYRIASPAGGQQQSDQNLAATTVTLDARTCNAFCERSVSDETRRVYRRAVQEFFAFLGHRRPALVRPHDVARWRDHLLWEGGRKAKAATVVQKLSVIRTLFEYLLVGGPIYGVTSNPASMKLVPVPRVSDELRGRALTVKEVRHLLSGPDRSTPEGARDYALMLLILRTSLRVSEAVGVKVSDIRWDPTEELWTLRHRGKGGKERVKPLPPDVKAAIDAYLHSDDKLRVQTKTGGREAFVFQAAKNNRYVGEQRSITPTMAWMIIKKWSGYSRIGHVSPHDLRRTAITRALDLGLTYREVQLMSDHADPKTLMRYDHGRKKLKNNAINKISYDEE